MKMAQWQTDPMWELGRQAREASKQVLGWLGQPMVIPPRSQK
jgi:hypothetical protein